MICLIQNQSAGLAHLKQPVDASDGLLDVMIFRDESVSTVTRAAADVLLRNENVVPLEHWQGREATVASQPAQSIQADGADTPSAMIGEHLASWLGQRFHQRELFMRALVVAGLGAGISATFFAQDTEGLKVLGAENVFVTSQPGAASKEAYEKAQQPIHP